MIGASDPGLIQNSHQIRDGNPSYGQKDRHDDQQLEKCKSLAVRVAARQTPPSSDGQFLWARPDWTFLFAFEMGMNRSVRKNGYAGDLHVSNALCRCSSPRGIRLEHYGLLR